MSNPNKTPTLRFTGFTDPWEQRKLSDLADIVGGGTPDTNNPDYWDGDIDWYAPAEMEGQRYAVGSVRKITELGLQKSSAKMLPAHRTVLFTSRAGIGKMAILKRPAATNQGFQSLVLKDGSDPYFIYSMGDKIKDMAEGVASGSTFLEISGNMLGNLKVMAPTIEEQKEIASFYREIDDLITLHQRKLEKLILIKKTLLEKMFPCEGSDIPEIRFSVFTDPWEQRKLLDCLTQPISDGPHETPDLVEEGIPFISVDAIVDNKIDFERKRGYITEEYDLECRKKYSPQRDDVYLVKSGSTVGKVAIVETDERFNIWSPLAAMRTNKEILLPKYLYYYLQLDDIQDEVSAKSKGGTQPNLSMRILEKFVVRLPDIEEQSKVSSLLTRLDETVTLHQRKLEKLKTLKKSMLEKMFV